MNRRVNGKQFRLTAAVVALLLLVPLLLVACGNGGDVRARHQSAQPATPTPTPAPTTTASPVAQPVSLAPVNWDDVEHFRAAMRPAFAQDIDAAASLNRYRIEATLTFEKHRALITGIQRVRFTNRTPEPLPLVIFRLYPNFPAWGGAMTVEHVWVNEQPVVPALSERDTTLSVPLSAPLPPGDNVEIAMTFEARAERARYASYGVFGFSDGIFAGPEWYPALSVYRSGLGWWTDLPPVNSNLITSEPALFDIMLTVPQELTVITGGTTLDAHTQKDGTRTLHIVTGPARDAVIVASAEFQTLSASVDGITVQIAHLPGKESAAEFLLETAARALRTFDALLGPYPFAQLSIVEAFNFTGIEYPSLAVIAERHWQTPDYLEHSLAHAIAHLWFNHVVGTDHLLEPWLDEALASYLEYVYVDAVYGAEAVRAMQDNDRAIYDAYLRSGAPDPVLNQPAAAFAHDNYDVLVYAKGPLFMLEIEQAIGHAPFLDALREFYERHRYQTGTTGDLYTTLVDETQADLDDLFAAWVGVFPQLTQSLNAASD